jgi:hypothetical protein
MTKTLPNLTRIPQYPAWQALSFILLLCIQVVIFGIVLLYSAIKTILDLSKDISIYSHHHKGRTHD